YGRRWSARMPSRQDQPCAAGCEPAELVARWLPLLPPDRLSLLGLLNCNRLALEECDDVVHILLRDLAFRNHLRHEVARLHSTRVVDPLGKVLGRIRQRAGPDRLAAAEVGQVRPDNANRLLVAGNRVAGDAEI